VWVGLRPAFVTLLGNKDVRAFILKRKTRIQPLSLGKMMENKEFQFHFSFNFFFFAFQLKQIKRVFNKISQPQIM
jgi:hypothetical protein